MLDLVVSERSGLSASRSSRSWLHSFLGIGVVLKGCEMVDAVVLESCRRLAWVACWPVEMSDFHILVEWECD